jgi:hypothetical protein
MPERRNPAGRKLATKLTELAMAAPQVMQHRVARMAMAGPVLSDRDRREFSGMVAEKQAAFAQSWLALVGATLQMQQTLALAMTQSLFSPSAFQPGGSTRLARQIGNATLGVASKGLEPFHRKTVANAKRLARTKLR